MYLSFIAAERCRIRVISGNWLMNVSEGQCSGHGTLQLLGLILGAKEPRSRRWAAAQPQCGAHLVD